MENRQSMTSYWESIESTLMPCESEGVLVGSKSRMTFLTGILAGGALSYLYAWGIRHGLTPGVSLSALTMLCATLAALRLVIRNRAVRTALAMTSVVLGGFLMAVGPRLEALDLHLSVTSVGTVAFLAGVALLLRERRVRPEVRERLIGRLIEERDASESVGPVANDGSTSSRQPEADRTLGSTILNPQVAAFRGRW